MVEICPDDSGVSCEVYSPTIADCRTTGTRNRELINSLQETGGMGNHRMKKSLRFDIFTRDEFTCQYCGKRPPDVMLHVDHIVPRSKGGSDDPENLITSCVECNLGKGVKPLEKAECSLDSFRRAQEALELIETAKTFSEAMESRAVLRQQIANYLCELLGVESVEKASVTTVYRAVTEFGSKEVMDWLDITLANVHPVRSDYYNEKNMMRYFSGIVRNMRKGEGKS